MRDSYGGVVIGVVKEINARKACVRLEYPWLDQSYRSPEAPIAAAMSGKQRGEYFMPELDDKVLVAFEQGEFDRPYVIGFLWNDNEPPPETDKDNRVIKTPGGHTLRFEDKKSAKKVIVKSSAGHNVTIDDAGGTITVSDAGGSNKINIDSGGTITIQAASAVNVNSNGTVSIQGSSTVTVQSSSEVTVDAPAINLASGASHPLVYGDELLTYMQTLMTTFNTHMHNGQLAAGFLPVTPMIPTPTLSTYDSSKNSSTVKTG